MHRTLSSLVLSLAALAAACAADPAPSPAALQELELEHVEPVAPTEGAYADVIEVQVAGEDGAYRLSVTVRSPDTGCERYADWWEVVTEEGELIYRRILTHSHVSEQPFTRSGGPIEIVADAVVLVRAHMHPDGFGGAAMKGSPGSGFRSVPLDPAFAASLESAPPLPQGCGF